MNCTSYWYSCTSVVCVPTPTATQEETSALGSSLVQLVDAVALSLLLLPGENVTIDLGNISEFMYLRQ